MNTLEDLNSVFSVTPPKLIDTWKITYTGDSEDYAVTLLWLLENKTLINFFMSLFKGKAKLIHCECKETKNYICVLYHSDYGFCSLATKNWNANLGTLKIRYEYPLPLICIKLLLGKLI